MGRLTKEDKDAMAEYFANKEEYDPTKDPKQATADFMPKMAQGGETGYADGGDVEGEGQDQDSALAALSPGMASAQAPADPGDGQRMAGVSLDSFQPQEFPFGSAQAPAAPARSSAPKINPADLGMYANALRQDQPALPVQAPKAPGKLAPDQFEELIQALSKPRTAGQRASSGLAALADGIISGVARAPSPGYAKNVEEQQQGHNEQLINALKAKYENGYKGQELQQAEERLTEEQRAHQAEEKAKQAALAEETRNHNLESGQRGAQIDYEQGKEAREAKQAESKNQVEAAQKILEAYKNAGVLGDIGIRASPSKAEYQAAQKVIQNNGGAGGASGPYGATTVRNGKTYQWSQATGKYHPVQ